VFSIIIPVYNEKGRLEQVLEKLRQYDEVIVIDDASDTPVDSYIDTSRFGNLTLIRHDVNRGYLVSIREGIAAAHGGVVVTMDGDGEHRPEDIPLLTAPIVEGRCDMVFGKRPEIARPSEVLLLATARMLTGETVEDAGTGFRAIRASYAKTLPFGGKCTCGMLLVEAHVRRMRICEVKVRLPAVDKPRRIAWEHFAQFFLVLSYAAKSMLSRR